jgi:glutamyl-tRNA synthetase
LRHPFCARAEYFARQYKGRLILRFDDTNPAKEKEDYVQNILADVAALGIVPDVVTYTSDHFDALLAKAESMIQEGHLYADNTPVEEMRAQRMDGIESACRAHSVDQNLALWREMVAGSEAGVKCCLRFKISMTEPNKAMRDPVAYRCNVDTPHHRTGSKYKVYPTYDAACPFVDAVEGVTHALRTSEYRDREAQYNWIQTAMGMRKVHIWDYSRLNFEFTTLSKRKLGWFVEAGKVEGWDDPRFPTVQGVRRRGLAVAALREFILSQGASRNLNTMTWEKLWTLNKRVIDPVCPRHTAVEDARVLLTLTNWDAAAAAGEARSVPRHKKHPPAGDKTQWLGGALWLDAAEAAAVAVDEEVTLMDWGNVIIRAKTDAADGKPATLTVRRSAPDVMPCHAMPCDARVGVRVRVCVCVFCADVWRCYRASCIWRATSRRRS